MQPIVNDFFCGCGGMGVGFLNAGYKIAGAWDFDKYAVQSYDHNVGHHVKQADIKEMTWQDVPFAHVWAFGFPCQDLSVAGKQAGLLLKCQDCDSDFAIDPSNKQFGNAVTTTVATGVAEAITDFLSCVGIIKEDSTMEEPNKETSAQTQTENPAVTQITTILQPKKERLAELVSEESRLKTEIEALELAISTIQNGGKENA